MRSFLDYDRMERQNKKSLPGQTMNMDEHLEALEDDFGNNYDNHIEKKAGDPIEYRMPWLTVNGPVVRAVQPSTKQSRWENNDDIVIDPNIAKIQADHRFNQFTEQVRKVAEEQRKRYIKQTVAQKQPQPSFDMQKAMENYLNVPMPVYATPPAPGSLAPTSVSNGIQLYQYQMSVPMDIIPRRSSSSSRSPRRRSRSRSPRRHTYGSPLSDVSLTKNDAIPEEDRLRAEENNLFVKLLYTKLMGIKSKSRLESLHVQLMKIVKDVSDEECRDLRR